MCETECIMCETECILCMTVFCARLYVFMSDWLYFMKTFTSHMVAHSQDAKYPDTKAIAIDDDHKKVGALFLSK